MTFKGEENKALELIKTYEKLNEYHHNYNTIDFSLIIEQERHYLFYKKWNELNLDELILESISNNIYDGLLNRLYNLINKHINLYKSFEDNFRNLDVSQVSKFATDFYFQHKIDLLNSEKKSITIEFSSREWERDILLEENNIELHKVIKNKTAYEINVLEWFSINYRLRVHELSTSFIAILNDYQPAEEIKNQNTAITNKETTYFDTELISKIYKFCNNEQFEYVTELDFIYSINLFPYSKPLKIKKDEIMRVYYLIYKLYNICDKTKRKNWLNITLENFGINKKTYNSKSKHCYTDTAEINIDFTKQIDKIFK